MWNKKGNAVAWILIILVLAGIVWWAASRKSSAPTDTATTTIDMTTPIVATSTDTGSTGVMGGKVVTINYTANGFEPATVTINKGDTVRWVNQSGEKMWVASAMHPTHIVYSGTDLKTHCATGVNDSFDQCTTGDTYSFTFDKTGSWGYHNHSDANDFGKIIVQ
jgi:plastocyanin